MAVLAPYATAETKKPPVATREQLQSGDAEAAAAGAMEPPSERVSLAVAARATVETPEHNTAAAASEEAGSYCPISQAANDFVSENLPERTAAASGRTAAAATDRLATAGAGDGGGGMAAAVAGGGGGGGATATDANGGAAAAAADGGARAPAADRGAVAPAADGGAAAPAADGGAAAAAARVSVQVASAFSEEVASRPPPSLLARTTAVRQGQSKDRENVVIVQKHELTEGGVAATSEEGVTAWAAHVIDRMDVVAGAFFAQEKREEHNRPAAEEDISSRAAPATATASATPLREAVYGGPRSSGGGAGEYKKEDGACLKAVERPATSAAIKEAATIEAEGDTRREILRWLEKRLSSCYSALLHLRQPQHQQHQGSRWHTHGKTRRSSALQLPEHHEEKEIQKRHNKKQQQLQQQSKQQQEQQRMQGQSLQDDRKYEGWCARPYYMESNESLCLPAFSAALAATANSSLPFIRGCRLNTAAAAQEAHHSTCGRRLRIATAAAAAVPPSLTLQWIQRLPSALQMRVLQAARRFKHAEDEEEGCRFQQQNLQQQQQQQQQQQHQHQQQQHKREEEEEQQQAGMMKVVLDLQRQQLSPQEQQHQRLGQQPTSVQHEKYISQEQLHAPAKQKGVWEAAGVRPRFEVGDLALYSWQGRFQLAVILERRLWKIPTKKKRRQGQSSAGFSFSPSRSGRGKNASNDDDSNSSRSLHSSDDSSSDSGDRVESSSNKPAMGHACSAKQKNGSNRSSRRTTGTRDSSEEDIETAEKWANKTRWPLLASPVLTCSGIVSMRREDAKACTSNEQQPHRKRKRSQRQRQERVTTTTEGGETAYSTTGQGEKRVNRKSTTTATGAVAAPPGAVAAAPDAVAGGGAPLGAATEGEVSTCTGVQTKILKGTGGRERRRTLQKQQRHQQRQQQQQQQQQQQPLAVAKAVEMQQQESRDTRRTAASTSEEEAEEDEERRSDEIWFSSCSSAAVSAAEEWEERDEENIKDVTARAAAAAAQAGSRVVGEERKCEKAALRDVQTPHRGRRQTTRYNRNVTKQSSTEWLVEPRLLRVKGEEILRRCSERNLAAMRKSKAKETSRQQYSPRDQQEPKTQETKHGQETQRGGVLPVKKKHQQQLEQQLHCSTSAECTMTGTTQQEQHRGGGGGEKEQERKWQRHVGLGKRRPEKGNALGEKSLTGRLERQYYEELDEEKEDEKKEQKPQWKGAEQTDQQLPRHIHSKELQEEKEEELTSYDKRAILGVTRLSRADGESEKHQEDLYQSTRGEAAADLKRGASRVAPTTRLALSSVAACQRVVTAVADIQKPGEALGGSREDIDSQADTCHMHETEETSGALEHSAAMIEGGGSGEPQRKQQEEERVGNESELSAESIIETVEQEHKERKSGGPCETQECKRARSGPETAVVPYSGLVLSANAKKKNNEDRAAHFEGLEEQEVYQREGEETNGKQMKTPGATYVLAAPAQKRGVRTPEWPAGVNTREPAAGAHAPEHPAGVHAPEYPAGVHAPEHPAGVHAPGHPAGVHAPEHPAGVRTPGRPAPRCREGGNRGRLHVQDVNKCTSSHTGGYASINSSSSSTSNSREDLHSIAGENGRSRGDIDGRGFDRRATERADSCRPLQHEMPSQPVVIGAAATPAPPLAKNSTHGNTAERQRELRLWYLPEQLYERLQEDRRLVLLQQFPALPHERQRGHDAASLNICGSGLPHMPQSNDIGSPASCNSSSRCLGKLSGRKADPVGGSYVSDRCASSSITTTSECSDCSSNYSNRCTTNKSGKGSRDNKTGNSGYTAAEVCARFQRALFACIMEKRRQETRTANTSNSLFVTKSKTPAAFDGSVVGETSLSSQREIAPDQEAVERLLLPADARPSPPTAGATACEVADDENFVAEHTPPKRRTAELTEERAAAEKLIRPSAADQPHSDAAERGDGRIDGVQRAKNEESAWSKAPREAKTSGIRVAEVVEAVERTHKGTMNMSAALEEPSWPVPGKSHEQETVYTSKDLMPNEEIRVDLLQRQGQHTTGKEGWYVYTHNAAQLQQNETETRSVIHDHEQWKGPQCDIGQEQRSGRNSGQKNEWHQQQQPQVADFCQKQRPAAEQQKQEKKDGAHELEAQWKSTAHHQISNHGDIIDGESTAIAALEKKHCCEERLLRASDRRTQTPVRHSGKDGTLSWQPQQQQQLAHSQQDMIITEGEKEEKQHEGKASIGTADKEPEPLAISASKLAVCVTACPGDECTCPSAKCSEAEGMPCDSSCDDSFPPVENKSLTGTLDTCLRCPVAAAAADHGAVCLEKTNTERFSDKTLPACDTQPTAPGLSTACSKHSFDVHFVRPLAALSTHGPPADGHGLQTVGSAPVHVDSTASSRTHKKSHAALTCSSTVAGGVRCRTSATLSSSAGEQRFHAAYGQVAASMSSFCAADSEGCAAMDQFAVAAPATCGVTGPEAATTARGAVFAASSARSVAPDNCAVANTQAEFLAGELSVARERDFLCKHLKNVSAEELTALVGPLCSLAHLHLDWMDAYFLTLGCHSRDEAALLLNEQRKQKVLRLSQLLGAEHWARCLHPAVMAKQQLPLLRVLPQLMLQQLVECNQLIIHFLAHVLQNE